MCDVLGSMQYAFHNKTSNICVSIKCMNIGITAFQTIGLLIPFEGTLFLLKEFAYRYLT